MKKYNGYRILVEKEESGHEWFYVQKKSFLFWKYLQVHKESDTVAYKIGWKTEAEAEAHIQSDVNYCYQKNQSKIISRTYIY